MIRSAGKQVAIWDPNPVNPYGQELAALIQEGVCDCVSWLPRNMVPIYAKSSVRVSASSRAGDGTFSTALRRFAVPLLYCITCAFTGKEALVVWIRGPYETFVFGSYAAMRPLTVIYHNPGNTRNGSVLNLRLWRIVLNRARRIVIHSESFLSQMPTKSQDNARSVPHLPYSVWPATYLPGLSSRATRRHGVVSVLFLGAVRKDKGGDDLEELIKNLPPDRFRIRLVGFGRDAVELRARYHHLASCEFNVSENPLPDTDVAEAIASADVMIAPYVGATQSGTVLLAFSSGLPVLGYRSGALDEILSSDALCEPTPQALAQLLDRWRLFEFPTFRQSPADLKTRATQAWGKVISG